MSKFITVRLKGDKTACINIDRILSIEKEKRTGFATIIMSDINVSYKTSTDYETFLNSEGIKSVIQS